MANFLDKIIKAMQLDDYDDREREETEQVYDEYEDEVETLDNLTPKRQFKSYSGGRDYASTNSKVVNFQANIQMEVVVVKPTTYDEAQEICDHIKSKRPVIINLEQMEKSIAQRIMDFVSGSCYTLNGNLERVTSNIFIISPENIDISGDFKEELKSNGIILPWKNEQ